MEKRKQYMKPEVELIIVDRLMDHEEDVPSASKGQDHTVDAKGGFTPDEDNEDFSDTWNAWEEW